jgi:acyl-CoA reductase-like NAD-dependent aldehyde dehydrogenase
MRVAREEFFGPVFVRIEFDTLEEAIKIANDSVYGLAATFWCDHVSQAHLAARRLRAGTVQAQRAVRRLQVKRFRAQQIVVVRGVHASQINLGGAA